MIIGIIGAMAQEITLLSDEMTNKKNVSYHHLTFITGQMKHKNIVLVQSGIGKVASAIAATVMITHFKVTHIINTGSAGSLKENLSIGNVVIGNQLTYHDVDAQAFGYQYGQVPQMPLNYLSSQTLIQAAQYGIENSQWHAVIGQIVSSDSFISGYEQINRIKKYFPNALCTEMEGASIAQTCHMFNIPFVVVRAISDGANETANMSFNEFIELAGKQSAHIVIKMLEVI